MPELGCLKNLLKERSQQLWSHDSRHEKKIKHFFFFGNTCWCQIIYIVSDSGIGKRKELIKSPEL